MAPQTRLSRRRALTAAGGLLAVLTLPSGAVAGKGKNDDTKKSHYEDEDGNGIPDEGETVTGAYDSVYAYDANGDWYWDLGDGRVRGTVDSISDLDQDTLTVCDYQVQYRGQFDNDPFLDNGWVMNEIICRGYDYDNAQTFKYTIVHETDPRYRGIEEHSIWGDWEYHVNVEGGFGNKLTRPENPP